MTNLELPSYRPDERVLFILEGHGGKNRIMAETETPQELLERVVTTLVQIEERFGTSEDEIQRLALSFAQHFVNRDFVLGMPTLTNAGRAGYDNAALSSCVVIPVDLRNPTEAVDTILVHYKQNMGSGFSLTKYEDPVSILRWLDDLSAQETATGAYDRRIAGMATLHVQHPKIQEFLQEKAEANGNLPHFNLSVEITDEFMEAAIAKQTFQLADGSVVDAYDLLQQIAQAAWRSGDPALVNLDRMNAHNPLTSIAAYECTPPCGEMGLAPGETCQFGYINLANYVNPDGSIQTERLTESVAILVRILDNAVEFGIERQPTIEGKQMALLKRKIGISVVGVADVLIKANLPYDSSRGRALIRDLVSLINYQAKVASVGLAERRGSCEAMKYPENLYFSGYLNERYAQQPTNTVSSQDWRQLDQHIRETGMLRNIHHTALPPGGRASLVLGVNHSLEPIFGPSYLGIDTTEAILDLLAQSLAESGDNLDIQTVFNDAVAQGTFQNLPVPEETKRVLKTAIEISPHDHLHMVAALTGKNGVSDESASKTVNLPKGASVQDVIDIYVAAHKLGLSNISVYRDGSIENQPRSLS